VRGLVRDLEEALDRGVSVEIYLNMKSDHGMPTNDAIERQFKSLIEKGAKIYKFTHYYLLHDKLLIVDGRYVVDGSTNWSVSALKSNYESTVLIDSPELAAAKLARLRRFPLEGYEKVKRRPDRPEGFDPLPKDAIVAVSKELLTNKEYFASMVRRQANRTMDTYLLLLAESARLNKKEFFVPLEEIAVTTGMSPAWSDSELRRQAIKELRALQNKYKLVTVNFSFGKDAWVVLRDLEGGTFDLKGDFFDPKNLTSKSQSAKFVLLMEALLASEGKSIDSLGVSRAAAMFGASDSGIRKGLKELK